MNSGWRKHSRRVIARTLKAWAEQESPQIEAAIAMIGDAYPFGDRSNHPYKQWLKERKTAIAFLRLKPPRPVDRYLSFAQDVEAAELNSRNRKDFVSPGQLSLL